MNLTLAHISKRYPGAVTDAVRGIALRALSGQVTGLMGENGAGKTTLMKIIAGLLAADKGEVLADNESVLNTSPEYRRRVGSLFSGDTGLYSRLTGRENIIYFGKLQGVAGRDIRRRIQPYIERFSMEGFIDRPVKEYSRGMKQKTALARALIHDPSLLLLDEPTSGLDLTSSQVVYDIVKEIRRQGRTVIIATHYIHETRLLCDEVVVLHNGTVAPDGERLLTLRGDRVAEKKYLSMLEQS